MEAGKEGEETGMPGKGDGGEGKEEGKEKDGRKVRTPLSVN